MITPARYSNLTSSLNRPRTHEGGESSSESDVRALSSAGDGYRVEDYQQSRREEGGGKKRSDSLLWPKIFDSPRYFSISCVS